MNRESNDYLDTNPFTPVFGKVPPFMVGRRQVIDDILVMFERPMNSPDRCSLFVGARGTGKTALLAYLAQEAGQRGWIVADVTAGRGMLDDIEQQVADAAGHLISPARGDGVTGLGVAGIGNVSWRPAEEPARNWRSRMNAMLDELDATGTGVLITVDEVNPHLEEMVQLVTVYQHFVREDRRVALLMAGLPYRMNQLLSGESTSFLRRAARHNLGSIPAFEVKEGFRLTVEESGRAIGDEALERAAEAIGGFPFMFQLVGYRAWNAAGNEAPAITCEHVVQGARLAREELSCRVFDATLAELSEGDVAFLDAMAAEGDIVERTRLAQRLGRSSGYISTYKKRLLEAGVIEEPRRGLLSFALPGFSDWLRAGDVRVEPR